MKKIGKTIGMIMLSVGTIVTVCSSAYLIGESVYKVIKDAPIVTVIFVSGIAMLMFGMVIKLFCEDFNNENEEDKQ